MRRTSRGGRDSIDHPAGGHDDLANAFCGALLAVSAKRMITVYPDACTALQCHCAGWRRRAMAAATTATFMTG
jgi:hypothetical protein